MPLFLDCQNRNFYWRVVESIHSIEFSQWIGVDGEREADSSQIFLGVIYTACTARERDEQ
jgi:hypothetical protein